MDPPPYLTVTFRHIQCFMPNLLTELSTNKLSFSLYQRKEGQLQSKFQLFCKLCACMTELVSQTKFCLACIPKNRLVFTQDLMVIMETFQPQHTTICSLTKSLSGCFTSLISSVHGFKITWVLIQLNAMLKFQPSYCVLTAEKQKVTRYIH